VIELISAQRLGLLPGAVLAPEREFVQTPLGLTIEGTVIRAKMTTIGESIVDGVLDHAHAYLPDDETADVVIWVPKLASREGLPEPMTVGHTVFRNKDGELVAFQRVIFRWEDRASIKTPSGSFVFVTFYDVANWPSEGVRAKMDHDRETTRPPADSIEVALYDMLRDNVYVRQRPDLPFAAEHAVPSRRDHG
jgi:hypothetical protein